MFALEGGVNRVKNKGVIKELRKGRGVFVLTSLILRSLTLRGGVYLHNVLMKKFRFCLVLFKSLHCNTKYEKKYMSSLIIFIQSTRKVNIEVFQLVTMFVITLLSKSFWISLVFDLW